jgi:hypothetical protein
MGALYVALLHGDVVDKTGRAIASSLTHFDLHDIARTCRAYEVERYYVVTPLESMRYLAERMIAYWREGLGNHSIPNRADALAVVEIALTWNEAAAQVEEREGAGPLLVATSARAREKRMEYNELARFIRKGERPVLLLFGTAYGLSNRVIEACEATLPPIRAGGWNHLSVRSAVAITLDRLTGEGKS